MPIRPTKSFTQYQRELEGTFNLLRSSISTLGDDPARESLFALFSSAKKDYPFNWENITESLTIKTIEDDQPHQKIIGWFNEFKNLPSKSIKLHN